jgi:predicted nucleotidyltransferase
MNLDDILSYLGQKQQFFRDNFGIRFIGVFGSYARDENTENSDVDILYEIEKDKKFSMFKYLKVTSMLEKYFNKKTDLIRNETIKPELKTYIDKDIVYV